MSASGGSPKPGMLNVIPSVVERHAAEAAFLWSLRDVATDQPHYTLGHLAKLEARLEAHIDALHVARDAGFEIARTQFDREPGPGELFVASTLALESRIDARVDIVRRQAEAVPQSRRGLFGALGWVTPGSLRGRVMSWFDAPSSFQRLAGVIACSLQRANPGATIERLLEDESVVRARALRLVGELGRVDLLEHVRKAHSDPDDTCRFWSGWSAGLLGDRASAIPILKTYAAADSKFQSRALELLVRLLDHNAAKSWIREFGSDPLRGRLSVVATGVLGDPVVVPWLLEKMKVAAFARVAAESFSMITGTDLLEDGLDGPEPSGFVASPDDENHDGNLTWPDPGKLDAWWQAARARFASNARYLRGVPLTAEACSQILREGHQRERRAAAYEWALISPGRVLWNWRARAQVQAKSLRAPTEI